MNVQFEFAAYGARLASRPGTLVVDVGMTMAPGVLDHHFPEAEVECAASLVVKHPELVLDHLRPGGRLADADGPVTVVTHLLPDFDALAAIFLALQLLETGEVDEGMRRLAAYTKLVDSASLPSTIDLGATPYTVLRALFVGSKKSTDEINTERIDEGLKFMRLLYARAAEGRDITEDRTLFAGIDRYERAVRKVEQDNAWYQGDVHHARKIALNLPNTTGTGRTRVDGLLVDNPHSFLLKEWARRDRIGSPLGQGFSFVLTSFNAERFVLSVDQAIGVNLRGLGAALNDLEARKSPDRPDGPRWYEGNCPFFDYRIVVSPHEGTKLSPDEIAEAVMDFGRSVIAG
jgi:hypothetical protein